MKIIKFLHASNFQLHLPVTCWTAPRRPCAFSVSRGGIGDGLSGENGFVSFDSHSDLHDTAANLPVWDPAAEYSDSGSDLHFPAERRDFPEDELMLEPTAGWIFGSVFPKLPPFIREECLRAVWQSAERVFELAVTQNVDFVLLTGDILQPDLCGARGIAFLSGQFRRLQERGIPVYWKLERSLEEWMLPDFRFPENVFLFPSNQAHIKKFRLPDTPKNIFIASWEERRPDFSHYDFSRLPDGKLPPFQTIAICPDEETFGGTKGLFMENGTGGRRENTAEKRTPEQVSAGISAFTVEDVFSGLKESFSTDGDHPAPRTVFFDPVCEVQYAALTASVKRFTARRSYESGKSVFLHSPGPIQYHEPPNSVKKEGPSPAGVTVVQMDLDGGVPVSLQFFPTETIGWRILEKRIPGEVADWESLACWMKETLRKEFSRRVDSQRSESPSGSQAAAEKGQENAASLSADPEYSESTGREESQKASESRPVISEASAAGNEKRTELDSESERVFVFWKLTSGKPAHGEMLRVLLEESVENSENSGQSTRLLSELRTFGASFPGTPWTVCVTPDPAGLIPFAWSQAETMLGDLLRLAQFHQMNPTGQTRHPDFASHSLDLSEVLSAEQRNTQLREMVRLAPEDENRILEAASILGASALAKAQKERNR